MTLDIITSDSLAPLPHGFFGRAGGASSGIFQGLNCALGSTDQAEIVSINRSRVAKALSLPASHLISPYQTHSSTTVVLEDIPALRPDADALVTSARGIALGILTADCAPVLLADHDAGIIGAAHAGWKGAFGGIIGSVVSAMRALGAKNIQAVVGPLISQKFYEVGPEFLETFLKQNAEHEMFFYEGKEDKHHFDLPAFVLSRLCDENVDAHWTGHCTYRAPDRFYSYRRSTHLGEKDYGRLISAISLPK